MALGDVIARLAAVLTLDTVAFEKGATLAEKRMTRMTRNFEQVGRKMSSVGRTMSLALTAPLVAFGVASVRAATESREALGQVEAALKSMGDGAGRTAEQLQALATGQMRRSLYDDDEILRKVTANLLTFGSVAGEQFDRAQQAAVDLAARMGTDLQSATIMIGKALNDPAKGLASLRRVGIQFTEQQQDQIKAMAAAGDAAGAQRIMLAELERQFGGSAAAMRAANPAAAMKQSWEEFKETVGEKLLPLLPRLADAVTRVLDAFGKLSPNMQTAVIAGAGLAAVLGPVLVAVGGLVQIAAPLLAFLTTMGGLMAGTGTLAGAASVGLAGFGSVLGSIVAAAGPWLVAIAGIAAAGYLIYQNWDKIAPVLENLWKTITETIGPPFSRLIAALTEELTALWRGPMGEAIREVSPYLIELGRIILSVLGPALIQQIKTTAQAIGLVFDVMATAVRALAYVFSGSLGRDAVEAVMRLYIGVKTWLQDKLGAVFDWVKHKVEAVGDIFHDLYMRVVGGSIIPDMIDGIATEMGRLDAVMVAPVTRATSKAQKAFRDMASEVRGLLGELFPEVAGFLEFQRNRELIGQLPEGMRDEAHMRLLRRARGGDVTRGVPFGDLDIANSGGLDEWRGGVDDFVRRLEHMSDAAIENTTRISRSFKQMAEDTLGSLSRLTSAIRGGGFLGILEAVIGLGLQLGSTGLFGRGIAKRLNKTVPGYAGGTNFHPGGLALVGERGPELVSMPRGSRVTPNNRMGGNTYYFNGNLMTEEFWARINAGDVGAARAGASGGVAMLSYANSRRVG